MLISRSGLQQVKAPGGGVCTLRRLGKRRTLEPNNILRSHLNLFIIVNLTWILILILTGTRFVQIPCLMSRPSGFFPALWCSDAKQ